MVKICTALNLNTHSIKKRQYYKSDLKYAKELKEFLEKNAKESMAVDDGKKERKENLSFGYYNVNILRRKNNKEKVTVSVRTQSDYDYKPVLDHNPTVVTFGLYMRSSTVPDGLISVKHDQTIVIEPVHGIDAIEFTKQERTQIEDAVWLQLDDIDKEVISQTHCFVKANIWDSLQNVDGAKALSILTTTLHTIVPPATVLKE